MLLVRGVTRRTGPRGLSIRATACWDLTDLHRVWREAGLAAVREVLDATDAVAHNEQMGDRGDVRPVRHPYALPGVSR